MEALTTEKWAAIIDAADLTQPASVPLTPADRRALCLAHAMGYTDNTLSTVFILRYEATLAAAEARIAALETALRPLAYCAITVPVNGGPIDLDTSEILLADVRAARALLAEAPADARAATLRADGE